MSEKISVVGLGKVGLGLALSFANAGFKTLGIDISEANVKLINRRKTPIVEPQYQELLDHVGTRFEASLDHARAINETDVTFILVSTPSGSAGCVSSRDVESAAAALGHALRQSEKPDHLFVISSTLVPGTSESRIIPVLEASSGRKLHEGFRVCYDPDFVALGSVIHDFTHPDVVVIGESHPEAGARVAAIHAQMCKGTPTIARMPIVSAEIAKVALNAYITVKITFANTLANLCEAIPGADVDAITKAISVDRRISPNYFNGGLAVGGTSFLRDTYGFGAVCREHGQDASLIQTVAELNDRQNERLSTAVLAHAASGKPIAVLGLAFKPNTPVIEASPAVAVVDALVEAGHEVRIYDRLALDAARARYGNRVQYAPSPSHALQGSGLVVLTMSEPAMLRAVEHWMPKSPATVIDCWRALDASKLHSRVTLVGLGRYSPIHATLNASAGLGLRGLATEAPLAPLFSLNAPAGTSPIGLQPVTSNGIISRAA